MEALYRIGRHLSGQRQGGGFEFATGNNQVYIVIFTQNESNVQRVGNDGERLSFGQEFGNLSRCGAGVENDGVVLSYKRDSFAGQFLFFLRCVSG